MQKTDKNEPLMHRERGKLPTFAAPKHKKQVNMKKTIITMALAIITAGGCFAQSKQKKVTNKKSQTTQTVKSARRAADSESDEKLTPEELNNLMLQKEAENARRDSLAREELKKMEQKKRQAAKKE